MHWRDEIVGLWATTMVRSQIGDSAILRQLADLADDDLQRSAALDVVIDEVRSCVRAYFQRHGVSSVPGFQVHARHERLKRGDSRGLRSSPNAYLTGMLFVQTPKDAGSLKLRDDARPGHVTLFDPRPGFNMLSIKNDPYRSQNLSIDSQAGLMVLWPGCVSYYCHPNLSSEDQIVILLEVLPSEGSEAPAPLAGEIHDAWPTALIKRRLPGFETRNPELMALVDAMEADNPSLTTDFNSNQFQAQQSPAREWLMASIDQSLSEYFKQMGMSYPISWDIVIWPNVNRFGDYHSPHNHPWSYLSGTYYVQVPEPDTADDEEYNKNSARISFYDPRASAVEIPGLPPGSPASRIQTIQPVPGALMIWPSSVYHFVHPNLSSTKRYTISFNVHLKWQQHYL